MNTNFPEGTEEAPEVPETPPSAQEPAQKKVIGRPITKETAKKYQLSAAAAKKRRKEARHNMLMALTSELDLGEEMVKAFKAHDAEQIALIEKAIRMIGLHYDQSEEGKASHLNIDAKADVKAKTDSSIRFIIEDAKPEA